MGKDAEQLSEAVANHYLNSCSVVEALGEKWGFDVALFVQPFITLSKKALTQSEKVILDDQAEPLRTLMAAIYRRLEESTHTRKRLFYVADVFDGATGEIWFDLVHVSGEGNRIVAERMHSILSSRPRSAGSPRSDAPPD